MAESKKVLSTEEVNSKLLESFKAGAEKDKNSTERISINRMDKDFNVTIPFKAYSEIRETAFSTGVMLKAKDTIGLYEKNSGVIITLCNAFVMQTIDKSFNSNLGLLKNEMTSIYLRNRFNKFIKSELDNNKKLFVAELKAL